MLNSKIIRAIPNRKIVFLATKVRADSVYDLKSYDKILVPIAKNPELHRRQFPHTLAYMKWKYCAYAYKLFKNII